MENNVDNAFALRVVLADVLCFGIFDLPLLPVFPPNRKY